METISFVIPCYRSEQTISPVLGELVDVMSRLPQYDYEIIAVNDASPDRTFDILREEAEKNPRVKVVSFLKNFGQHAGMMAGVRFATGDYIVFLDDDGQCPVDQLASLLEPLTQGADIAIAQYGTKKQSAFKNLCSAGNEWAANLLTDKPKDIQMGNFMAIRRVVAAEIARYEGPYPYLSGLLFRTSRRVVNVPMQERNRAAGHSTYTFVKLFSLWMNSFTAFSVKPLRFAAVLGTLIAAAGFFWGAYIVLRKLLGSPVEAGWSSLIATILFLDGVILFVLGIIGEYIGRIYMTLNQTPQYIIRETINCEEHGHGEYT